MGRLRIECAASVNYASVIVGMYVYIGFKYVCILYSHCGLLILRIRSLKGHIQMSVHITYLPHIHLCIHACIHTYIHAHADTYVHIRARIGLRWCPPVCGKDVRMSTVAMEHDMIRCKNCVGGVRG